MKKLASLLLGGVGALVASGAMAADIQPVVVPGPVVVAPPPAPPGYSWTGFYVGAQAGAWFENDFEVHSARFVGQAGFDFEVGERFVVGAFAQAGINDGGDFEWAAGARGGVALGQRALLYAATSLTNGPNGDLGVNLVGGAEFAVGQRFSIFAEGGVFHDFGDTPFVDHIVLSTGVNFRFGR